MRKSYMENRANKFTCNDCPDRKLHCHETCEKYKEEKAAAREVKAQIAEDRRGRDEVQGYVNKSLARYRRRMNRWDK